jgi:hypothetical protein
MQTISIGQLQKNVGILTRLTEALTIVDKRKNKSVAVVYPVVETPDAPDTKHSMTSVLAGKYNNLAKHNHKDFRQIRDEAMYAAMKEKHGFAD